MLLSLVRSHALFSICIVSNCAWIILLHPVGPASFVVHMCIWKYCGSRSIAIVCGLARSTSSFCAWCFFQRRMLFVCNATVLRLRLVAIGFPFTITSMLHHTLHLQALGLGSLECQWFASFLNTGTFRKRRLVHSGDTPTCPRVGRRTKHQPTFMKVGLFFLAELQGWSVAFLGCT